MSTVLIEFAKAFVKLLPATLARALVLVILVLAFGLHLRATARITALEHTSLALTLQTKLMAEAVTDLTAEIRGYRNDIREENKELKRLKPLRGQNGASASAPVS